MRPTRLYIKQCSHCEKRYFGKSTSSKIESYQGSGKLWKLHLAKHNAFAIHKWHSDWYYDEKTIRHEALKFSAENDIVRDNIWCNLIAENGVDGGDTSKFVDRRKLSDSHRGDKNPAKRPEVREKISRSLTGKKASAEAIRKNSEFRKGKNKSNYEPIKRMAETQSRIMSGLTKENSEMRRNHAASLSKSMTGKTKETCPRIANAAKSIKETLRKIKQHDRIKIVNWVDNDGLSWKQIKELLAMLNVSIGQIKKAYNDAKSELQVADAGSILIGEPKEMILYYHDDVLANIKASDIVDLSDYQLAELAQAQKEALYKHHPLNKEVQKAELQKCL